MEEMYDFAGALLLFRHDGSGLASGMDKEIGYYRTERPGDADCSIRIEKTSSPLGVPEKAVRSYFLDGQSVYSLGRNTYILGREGKHLISVDLGSKEIDVRYSENSEGLMKVSRWLLKWLIIKSVEERGAAYIHASAARHCGRTVLFSGDSHSGKSSSLLRLVARGAKAISDDSVIFDGKNIIPFTFNTSIDEDLAGRFALDRSSFSIGEHVEHDARYSGADIVLFLRIWNNKKSEVRPLDYKQALLFLIRSYQKELPFTIWSRWEEGRQASSRLVFAKYSSLLETARCFEFYAGNDEEEVRSSLLRLVEKPDSGHAKQLSGQPRPVPRIGQD